MKDPAKTVFYRINFSKKTNFKDLKNNFIVEFNEKHRTTSAVKTDLKNC